MKIIISWSMKGQIQQRLCYIYMQNEQIFENQAWLSWLLARLSRIQFVCENWVFIIAIMNINQLSINRWAYASYLISPNQIQIVRVYLMLYMSATQSRFGCARRKIPLILYIKVLYFYARCLQDHSAHYSTWLHLECCCCENFRRKPLQLSSAAGY